MKRQTVLLVLAACLGALPALAAGNASPAWLMKGEFEGVVSCSMADDGNLRVHGADLRFRNRNVGRGLIGQRCSEAFRYLLRRADVHVEQPVALHESRDELVFSITGPHNPVPTQIGCTLQDGSWMTSWRDKTRKTRIGRQESCLDVVKSARKRGFTVDGPLALGGTGQVTTVVAEELLVSLYESSLGRPDRAAAIMGCQRDGTDGALQVSFIDTSDGPGLRKRIRPGDACARARQRLASGSQLLASATVAVNVTDLDAADSALVFTVHTQQPDRTEPPVYSCDGFPDSAPAGDLLVVTDANDRVLRTEPQACSLMGADAALGPNETRYEIVASAELTRLVGGVDAVLQNRSAPLNCGTCRELKNEPAPQDTAGLGFVTWTPTLTHNLGVQGDFPYGNIPYAGADWHWANYAPSQSSRSSLCTSCLHWGQLTNSRGWEVVKDQNGIIRWGNTAYTMYDAYHGWIRSAAVFDASGQCPVFPWAALLHPSPRFDICAN